MKSFAIALSILFIMFVIGSNALSSSSNAILIKERKESYQACIRLRTKAPNLNLQCENLLENIPTDEETEKNNDKNSQGVKFLSNDVSLTRKVNKKEEIKLRNLIKKLSNENRTRRD